MNKKIFLSISLALNIILIGLIAAHMLGIIKPPHHKLGFEKKLIATLPQEKQKTAEEVFDKIEKIHRDNFAKNKESLHEAENVVTAEKFDKTKFLSAMAKTEGNMIAVKKESNKILAEFLASLTQDERKKLVEEFKLMNKKHFHKMDSEEKK